MVQRAGRMLVGVWLAFCLPVSKAPAAVPSPEPAPRAAAAQSAVFAVVNGTTITAQEYETALNSAARNKFYHRQPPEAELNTFKREISDRMVNRVLLLEEARRRGLTADQDKIREALSGYERRYKDSPMWQKQRAEVLPRLQRELEQQNMLERIEHDIRQVRSPSDAEARAFHRAHPDLFTEPEQVRLSVILLKVDPSSPKIAWDKAREEGRSIAKRIANGTDFGELARMHSADGSAQNGGDMGYVHRGMLPQGMHDEVDKLKPGMSSEVLTLLDGVALVKLTDRKISRQRAYDDVQKRAADLWQREQSEKKWTEFLAALRGKATIKIDLQRYPELGNAELAKRGQANR